MSAVKTCLCYNCFQERQDPACPCPYCGFDLEENVKKFPVALRAGTVLNDRYIVGRVLGQGGFGITYLAWDTKLEAKVAVKEFMPSEIATRIGATVSVAMESKTDEFTYGAERFQEEARTLAKFMGQPNIAGVTDYFDENDTSYFVMDYIEGISFKTYIANQGGKVTVDEALNVMIPVLRALTAVHAEGFIHRDVTPDNIYITKDGQVKLLDFGSARYSIGDKSKSLDVVLKVGYAPKEQYIRRGRQGPYTDVYSCAACFYAALTGYLPPESLERLDHDELVPVSQAGIEIPEWLDKAILKGLAVQPEDRFQSAAEFLDAVESQQVVEVPGSVPVSPTAGSQLDALIQKMKKRPKSFGVIAVAVVALIVVIRGFGGNDGSPLRRSPVPSITIAGETYSTDERRLELENQGLTDEDIQGLQYMVNLTYLNLNGNNITDVTSLAGLTELTSLRLGQNDIIDVSPLSGLTKLEYIDLRENPNLTDLSPLAGLTNMTEFSYYKTPITDLSFMAGWTKMEYLELYNVPAGSLDILSGLTNVRNVYTNGSDNYIDDLSFLSGMKNLEEVSLQGYYEELDLSPLADKTKLTRLSLYQSGNSGVSATDLSPLAGLAKLQELDLDANVASLDDLASMTELRSLRIYSNSSNNYYPLENISALSGMTKLTELQLQLGNVKDLSPLANLTKLTSLNLYGNFYTDNLNFLSGMTELRELHISNSSNIHVSDLSALSGLTDLQSLSIGIDGLQSLHGLENMSNLKELSLYGSDALFTDVNALSALKNLQSLRLPNRNSDGPAINLSGLSGLTALQDLQISGRTVSLEPLSGLIGLKSLQYTGSNGYNDPSISLAPLSSLTGLTELDLNCNVTDNDLSPLSNLTELRTLSLYVGNYDNPIQSLEPLGSLTNLTSLTVSDTVEGIDTSPVAHVPSLNIN